MRWFAAALLVVAGCGDDGPVCPVDVPGLHPPYCASAMNLALRNSEHLVLQQDEVNYYYALQKPAYAELTTLRTTSAGNDSENDPDRFLIQSNYPPILEAWNAGEVRVGEDRVDRWFGDAGAVSVERLGFDGPDGFQQFYVEYERFVSWRVLEQGLEEIPDTQFNAWHYLPPRAPDLLLEWDGDDAVFTFLAGWGDCIAGCAGSHTWEARVTPDFEVTIEDLGGDPVPDWFQDNADERPPPP